MNNRSLWGEFTEDKNEETTEAEIREDKEIYKKKKEDLKILNSKIIIEPKETNKILHLKNKTVNQIIGLKRKQEIIESIIDTYQWNLKGSSITLSSLQNIPTQINPTNTNKRFVNFIPPKKTIFTTGKPKEILKINKSCVELALRKSICGLVRLTNFNEIDESALVMLSDAVNHFYKSLMESVCTVLLNENRETDTLLDIITVEKALLAMTHQSMTSFYNYFKNEIYQKHRETVSDFNEKLNDLKEVVAYNNQFKREMD